MNTNAPGAIIALLETRKNSLRSRRRSGCNIERSDVWNEALDRGSLGLGDFHVRARLLKSKRPGSWSRVRSRRVSAVASVQ